VAGVRLAGTIDTAVPIWKFSERAALDGTVTERLGGEKTAVPDEGVIVYVPAATLFIV